MTHSKLTLQWALVLSLAGYGRAGTVSPDFKTTNSRAPVSVMVQLDNPPTTSMLNALAGNGGAIKVRYLRVPKVLLMTVPEMFVPVIARLELLIARVSAAAFDVHATASFAPAIVTVWFQGGAIYASI